MTKIAFTDYPHNWHCILEQIVGGLQSHDLKAALTGLSALLSVSKRYRYAMLKPERE
jgi:hypothetical protein